MANVDIAFISFIFHAVFGIVVAPASYAKYEFTELHVLCC